MFIDSQRGWYTRSGQHASGAFLVVVADPFHQGSRPELRAFVRHVRMDQCGHFMMGHVTVGGFRLALSGCYGHDGLPDDLDTYYPKGWTYPEGTPYYNRYPRMTSDEKRALWDQLVPLPPELQDAFWSGGGHNDAGTEGPAIAAWARENLARLRRPIKAPTKVAP